MILHPYKDYILFWFLKWKLCIDFDVKYFPKYIVKSGKNLGGDKQQNNRIFANCGNREDIFQNLPTEKWRTQYRKQNHLERIL